MDAGHNERKLLFIELVNVSNNEELICRRNITRNIKVFKNTVYDFYLENSRFVQFFYRNMF